MKKLAILTIIFFALVASKHSQAQVVQDTPPLDNFYVKVNNVGRTPQPYVHVREADVYIKRRIWRMIDFREKFNQHFYFPIQPVQDRVSFMSMVMTALREGSITAYDPITDDFTRPYTFEEFMATHTRIVEREVEDLDNPGQLIRRSDTTTFSNQDVIMLRVKEDWFIDRQRGMRETRILGLAPVRQMFDEQTGESRGIQTLFWLYYPDCRDVFVNTEAFNRHNSAMRMSYDDTFAIKRFFNSYVTKMDNQQDRHLQDFLSGWQLLEVAQQIEIDLLNLEEDLWEY